MGYVLLWIESLTALLLLAATLLAWIARLRRRWLRRILSIAVVLLLLLPFGLWTIASGYLEIVERMEMGFFYPLLALTVGLTIGVLWIWVRAIRQIDAGTERPEGSRWPLGRLAFALLVCVALNLLTFSNIDAAIKQRLGSVRSEAAALALSVAPAKVPDRDNAALIYQQVFDALEDLKVDFQKKPVPVWMEAEVASTSQSKVPFDFKDPRLADFLRKRAPELALLRLAVSKPGCYFEHDYARPGIDMMLPEMQSLRDAARLLAVDARYKAAIGDARGALEDVNALFIMPEHATSEPLLISALVAIALDSLAAKSLESVLATLPPPSADDLAVLRIDPNVSYRRIVERSMRLEEASGLMFYCEMGDGGNPLRDLDQMTGQSRLEASLMGPFYRVFALGDDMTSYRQVLRRGQQMASQPYYRTKDRLKDIDAQVSRNWQGVLARLLVPSLEVAIKGAARGDARRSVARVGLAMYIHRLFHGKFPTNLDDLAPEAIDIVPRDSFDGKALKLRQTDHGWVVYSIGPNLIDDHGKERTYRNGLESEGDITFEYSTPR